MASLLETTKRALKEAGVVPSKGLGQNFMIDHGTINDIISASDLRDSDTVLEIGAGTGNLTRAIAEHAGKVYAVEYDHRLAQYLSTRIATEYTNIEVIEADAVDLDMPPFNKVVSNLPYSISSPIIFKLLEVDFSLAVLTLQEEFAYRLLAPVGIKAYSRISVKLRLFADIEGLFHVPKRCFYPVPDVDSVCVALVPKSERPDIASMDVLDAVTRAAFSQRRKKIKNSLIGLERLLPLTREEVLMFISALPKDVQDRRAENLGPEEFVDIANGLYEFIGDGAGKRVKAG